MAALSIETAENVATPPTGVTAPPPVSTAVPGGFVPIASEIWFANPVATLLLASSAVTVIAGAMAAPDAALDGP